MPTEEQETIAGQMQSQTWDDPIGQLYSVKTSNSKFVTRNTYHTCNGQDMGRRVIWQK